MSVDNLISFTDNSLFDSIDRLTMTNSTNNILQHREVSLNKTTEGLNLFFHTLFPS
jgi:hypothetical protein